MNKSLASSTESQRVVDGTTSQVCKRGINSGRWEEGAPKGVSKESTAISQLLAPCTNHDAYVAVLEGHFVPKGTAKPHQ